MERGFGFVSMDEPPAWRLTLYNKFARKEDIFRMSGQLENALSPASN